MDIRLTFDGVASVYERARPTYPAAIFDGLFERLPAGPEIVEVGPGAGQATADLLARGAKVTACELGPNFARRLGVRFEGEPRLTVVNDSFEGAELAVLSFDAVVSASAYHWIEAQAQLARPVEVLRPGGLLAVISLIQVDSAVDGGYFERVTPIYESYGQGKNDEPKTYASAVPPMVPRLYESGLYSEPEVHRVRWDQTYSSSEYRELLWSYSGTQMMPEPERSAMVDELVAVLDDEFGGQLTRPLVVTMTTARVR